MKYKVSMFIEGDIEGIEVDTGNDGPFDEEDLAEQAARKWMEGISQKTGTISITSQELMNWERIPRLWFPDEKV